MQRTVNRSKRIVLLLRDAVRLRACVYVLGCDGGQVWTNCGSCVKTCKDYFDHLVCSADCQIGCRCPQRLPIWHEGQCITSDQCPGSYIPTLYPDIIEILTLEMLGKAQRDSPILELLAPPGEYDRMIRQLVP